jgi:hypothetical protein
MGLLPPFAAQRPGEVPATPSGTLILEATPPRPKGCLHEENGPAGPRRERDEAAAYIRAVVEAERAFASRSDRYAELYELTELPLFPAGWRVQLTASAVNYVASIKDTNDPCAYGLYADHYGTIYSLKPLTGTG